MRCKEVKLGNIDEIVLISFVANDNTPGQRILIEVFLDLFLVFLEVMPC
jgi:hypothetical protein